MYIYGKNVVKETLKKDKFIRRAYLSKNFKDQTIIDKLKQNKVKMIFTDKNTLSKKVSANHQGIILEIEEIQPTDINTFLDNLNLDKNPIVVMLDHLEDPHNFGAIIRTSEALGIAGIIIPNDRSVGITDTVIKTSAGAIYNIPIIRVPNLQSTITKLKQNKFWIVGTDMQGEDYTKIDYNSPICLIIGNEGKGMSPIIKKNCDHIASIPMSGKINSLNASVSCGIILSEIVNVRKKYEL